jgi:saposin
MYSVFLFLLALLVTTNAQTCDLCEYVIMLVDQQLEQNATQQEILAIIETACNVLPSDAQAYCIQEVKAEGPQLIKMFTSETPQEACELLGLCTAEEEVGDTMCSICELVVNLVEEYVAENATQSEIEQDLDQMCSLIPGYSADCLALVKQYLPQIIQWVVNKEDPLTFCSETGFCTPTPPAVVSGAWPF